MWLVVSDEFRERLRPTFRSGPPMRCLIASFEVERLTDPHRRFVRATWRKLQRIAARSGNLKEQGG